MLFGTKEPYVSGAEILSVFGWKFNFISIWQAEKMFGTKFANV